jgi:hypothetical protein
MFDNNKVAIHGTTHIGQLIRLASCFGTHKHKQTCASEKRVLLYVQLCAAVLFDAPLPCCLSLPVPIMYASALFRLKFTFRLIWVNQL